MQHTKFYDLYFALPSREQKHFLTFLQSPFFNQSPRLVKLGEYFLANKKPMKEEAFAYVYTAKRKYNDVLMRRLMNSLLEELKRFMEVSSFLDSKMEKNTFLLRKCKELNQEKMLNEVLGRQEQLITKFPKSDSTFYYHQFLLETEKYSFNLIRQQIKVESRLPQIFGSLEQFYLFNKLKYYCHALSQKNIIKTNFQILYKEEILKNIKEGYYKNSPGIMIYYHIMAILLEEEEEKNFRILKNLLKTNFSLFVHEEARDMHLFAQNYCIKQINKGNSDYLKEVFYFYQFTIDKNILYENGRIPPQTFKNIVTTALRLKKLKWSQAFIKNYVAKVGEKHQANAYRYNMANLYYYQQKYGACLKLLQEVDFKEAFYGFDAKVLLFKTFYEQGDYEALDRFWFSFYMYVKRNRFISDAHKTSYLNFLKFTRKLMVADKSNQQKMEQLKAAIQHAKPISNINWLLEMVEKKLQ